MAIFPRSLSDFSVELADGSISEAEWLVAYHPIEVPYPYTVEELAEAIEEGIHLWNKFPCYRKKKTYEAQYYGVGSFRAAMKGKRYIRLGWDEIAGKYVWLSFPTKSAYAYIGLEDIRLPDEADWIDFAKEVIKYVAVGVTTLRSYKVNKKYLNL